MVPESLPLEAPNDESYRRIRQLIDEINKLAATPNVSVPRLVGLIEHVTEELVKRPYRWWPEVSIRVQ